MSSSSGRGLEREPIYRPGFFFHGSQKTQGEKNSSPEKTQAIFGQKTQGTRGCFENLPTKT